MSKMTCANCNGTFEIYEEDRAFYRKIKVPEPTWCPECRNMRRCTWRNERVLYSRSCDLCQKKTLSIYSSDAPYVVYCRTCWWSDKWDAMDYGRDFEFSRPFFEQFNDLMREVPRIALMNKKTENSEYCNEVEDLQDSYLAICSFFGQRLLYTYWLGWSNDCTDCNFSIKNELCYESQDIKESYGCRFVYNSKSMTNSAFCFSCFNCSDCFMSVNLRNKSYCIKNKQYTKEEYVEEMEKIKLGSHEAIEKLKKEFWEYIRGFPRKFAFVSNSEDCVGDRIDHSKNVYYGFDIFELENSRYVFDAGTAKDCMDLLQSGLDSELLYETHSLGWAYNIYFSNWYWHGKDSQYVDSAQDCHDLFGCAGVRKKEYCIFNKQYSESKYKRLREKIIAHMKETGEYGEFFPVKLAPYAYNETVAQQWYPKTKEEVEAKGWKWQNDMPGKYGKGTVEWKDVADDIKDVDDSIVKEVLSCSECSKKYKLVQPEFDFYKKHTIPIPRKCPDCRFYERLELRNPRKLWHRQCMCELKHGHHAGKRCQNEFETSYASEREENVFCEPCFQEELS